MVGEGLAPPAFFNIFIRLFSGCRGRHSRKFWRISLNNQSTCHPELVELFSSEERGKSKAQRAAGISFKISVAFYTVLHLLKDVRFSVAGHRNSLRDPFVAIAPRFCLFAYAQPAKLRLAACRLLRDDIQRRYSMVIDRWYYVYFAVFFVFCA